MPKVLSNVEAQLQQGWNAKSALKIVIEKLVTQFNAARSPLKSVLLMLKILVYGFYIIVNTEHAAKPYPKGTILIAGTLTPASLRST